jgi:hypothetical protein
MFQNCCRKYLKRFGTKCHKNYYGIHKLRVRNIFSAGPIVHAYAYEICFKTKRVVNYLIIKKRMVCTIEQRILDTNARKQQSKAATDVHLTLVLKY